MDRKYTGAQIRNLRHWRGYTQKELAERSGVSAALLGHVERGVRGVNAWHLAQLSEALDVPVEMLILPEDSAELLTAPPRRKPARRLARP